MTIARSILLLSVCGLLPAAAWAQSPDCPKRGVAMPSRPPNMPQTQTLPPDAVFDAEEGHVSAILNMERALKAGPVPASVASIASDVSATPLARWSYEGYLPERVAHRVSRFFRGPDGSIVALGEWDYKPDVGDVQFPGMNNATVAGKPAGLFSLRSPSGCVSTTLSWKDDRKLYRLEIVGPLDIESQRAALTRLGESLARPM
jgi:hypothetical protein